MASIARDCRPAGFVRRAGRPPICALVRALLKRRVDEEITLELPGGRMTYEVVQIDYRVELD